MLDHVEYATEVDNYNVLARIPFIGLRIPLKYVLPLTTYNLHLTSPLSHVLPCRL